MRLALRLLAPYVFFIFLAKETTAQNCFSTGLNGSVINLPCNVNCTTFKFQVPHLKSTEDYSVTSIPYTPYPYTTSNPALVLSCSNQDDKFFDTTFLPFSFCFYGNVYTKMVVSTNGLVTFDTTNALKGSNWSFTAANAIPFAGTGTQGSGTCPTPSGTLFPRAAIFGAYYDIDIDNPGVNKKMEYRVEGTAPCRRAIISFNEIPLFSCTSVSGTQQIVIYESTGLIEVYIQNKPACNGWNDGLAILGIQNWERNKAVAAPGKNATQWTATNEAYRFIPSGPTSRFMKAELWDMSGNVLATTGITAGADTSTTTAGMLDINFPQQCLPAAVASGQFIIKTYFSSCSGGAPLVSSDTITVNKTTSLNATSSNVTASACGPNGSFTINIPTGAGTPPYSLSLNGNTPVTTSNQSYTFTGLLGGNHTVVLTTAGGCSQTLSVTVPTSGVLSVNAAPTATSCNGSSDGSITLTPQNGVSPFQYSINGGAFVSFAGPSHTITNLPTGNYFLTIRDASGCQLTNSLVSVGQGGPLTVSINAVPPACPGASNGSITVTPTSGTAPYTYSFNGQPFQASNTFNNLPSGVYFISVRDAIGCYINNVFANVGPSNGTLNVTATATGTSCNGVSNGSITITPANGSAPYQYSIDGGTTFLPGTSITGLAAGNYSVIVKDAAGCTSSPVAVTVPQGNALLATAAATPTSCTGVSNGTITVTPTNGAGPYTYSLDGGTPQSSNTFTGVSAGNHTIIVTDGAGCVSNAIPVTVSVGPAITGTTNTTATSCNGATDGTITVTPTTGAAPYTYSLDGGAFQASNTFTGVSSGNHNVVIRDAAGCTSNPITVTVTAGPALTGTAASTPTTCSGVSNGSINVTPTNGTGPFEYSLDNGPFQASNIFSNVAAGSHTVVIRNAAGCLTASIPVTVSVGPALTGSATASSTSCSGASDGVITATPTAGIGIAPYTYSLNGGAFQSSNSFANVAAGNHSVVIRDAVGCTSAAIAVTVTAGQALTATTTVTPTSCSGATNGTITVNTTNGTGPFEYSIDGSNFQSSNVFTGLATGNYTITWRNSAGCQSSIQATVNPGQPLTATVGTNNVLCNGGSNGSATVVISTNGAPPYEYSLDGVNWQASNVFTGLAAGSYTVAFRDQNNCSGTQSFTITQPNPLTISPAQQAALCNGQSNGNIIIAASGGTAPYEYSIDGSNYQSVNSFNVGAGTYTVYVRDNNNCVRSQQVVITEPALLTASASSLDASCTNNGTITVSGNGGSPTYEYSLDGVNFQSSNTFSAPPGSYSLTIRDANGCTATASATVGLTNNLNVVPAPDLTICEGLSVQLAPNTNATQFSWAPAASLNAANIEKPLATPATTTSYIVTASLGICSANDTIVVNVLPAPIANAGPDGDICYGQTFQLQGSGGVDYQWTPNTYLNNSLLASPTVTPDKTMQYALHVTDANGCRSLQPDMVTVNVTPPIVVSISKDTVVAAGDVLQLFSSSVATDYTWSPAFGLNDPNRPDPVATITSDITYTVTATTSAGCKGEASVTIKVYAGPEIYVPTAFTPNNDGKNDLFKPFPVGIKRYTYFRVYNRWGQLIFSTTEFNRGWDGTINGKPQPTGTYVWVVEGYTKEDKKIAKKGVVTLIR